MDGLVGALNLCVQAGVRAVRRIYSLGFWVQSGCFWVAAKYANHLRVCAHTHAISQTRVYTPRNVYSTVETAGSG